MRIITRDKEKGARKKVQGTKDEVQGARFKGPLSGYFTNMKKLF
jgi:hypothetical protein